MVLAALTLSACKPEPVDGAQPPAPSSSVSTPTDAATPGLDGSPAGPDAGSDESSDNAACTDAGGTVQQRVPTSGTDADPGEWITLAGIVEVCRFGSSESESAHRLYVDIMTVEEPAPTLAALAYFAKVPVSPDAGENSGDAALDYCSGLGGTYSYGPSAIGGLVDVNDPIDTAVTVCTFADGSFVDTEALLSYSARHRAGRRPGERRCV